MLLEARDLFYRLLQLLLLQLLLLLVQLGATGGPSRAPRRLRAPVGRHLRAHLNAQRSAGLVRLGRLLLDLSARQPAANLVVLPSRLALVVLVAPRRAKVSRRRLQPVRVEIRLAVAVGLGLGQRQCLAVVGDGHYWPRSRLRSLVDVLCSKSVWLVSKGQRK